MTVARITFLPDHVTVEARKGQSLLAAALKAGIPATHACGGNARCTTCRLFVVEGLENLSEPTWRETRVVKRLDFGRNFRLACQTTAEGDVTVRRLVIDPADVALTDIRDRPAPVGREQEVAVLFCDIRDFTTLAERQLPYDVIHLLNRHYFDMNQVILAHGGIVTAYMGDGLMALFGVDDPSRAAFSAIDAGLGMVESVKSRAAVLADIYGQSYEIGVGIHFGRAVIGYLGGEAATLTAIGDVVNVAARIESANKQVGSNLLVSREAFDESGGVFQITGKPHEMVLKGKTDSVTLYEIKGRREARPEAARPRIRLED